MSLNLAKSFTGIRKREHRKEIKSGFSTFYFFILQKCKENVKKDGKMLFRKSKIDIMRE